jgi:hypothetical protein
VLGGAWIVPRSMLKEAMSPGGQSSATQEGRALIERIAMETVMSIEEGLGHNPEDVGTLKIGYDIVSKAKDDTLRFIEVKGRQAGAGTVTVTHNEMVTAANKPDNTYLAVVEVDRDIRNVVYYTHWVSQAPGIEEVCRTLDLKTLKTVANIVLERLI